MTILLKLFKNAPLFSTLISVKKVIITILILSVSINLFSQSYPFRHYTVEDGLPSSETYHVFQDSKGYIWIATDNGVSRYDGYKFRNFTKQDGLPDNTVFEIFEDYKNRIWFVPHSAKLSYFYKDSIFEYEFNDSLLSRMRVNTSPAKLSFYVDSLNNVIYSDKRNGGLMIDSLGSVIELSKSNQSCYLHIIEEKIIYNTQNVSPRKISLESISDSKINLLKEFNSENIELTDCSIPIKKGNNILIADFKILIKINRNYNLSYLNYPDPIIWLSEDNKGDIWIGTRNGVYCHENFNATIPKYHLLKGKNISSVLQDNENGFWFSTLYDGIYYLPNIYINNFTIKDGLPYEEVKTVNSDSSFIWLGLKNKLIGLKSKKIQKEINLESNNIIIRNIFSNHKNKKLWIAASSLYSYQNNILNEIDFKRKEDLSTIHSAIQPKDIEIDVLNKTWIATGVGLFVYDEKAGSCINTEPYKNKINSICQRQNDPYLLCGCNDGLWEYSIINDTHEFLGAKNTLLKDQIDCIVYNTYHDNMWLGTKTNGIVIYDQDEIYNISTKNGLSNNSITSLFLKDNVMWATTRNGLNKITFHNKKLKHSFKIESFNKIHGLLSREINDIYVDDSLAYVATKKGLNIINYNKIKETFSPPPIYITNISIQNQDTTIQDHYVLPYNKNSINIGFVGLMYRNNENKKYKYQFNQNTKSTHWVETNERYVKLSFLPPGKYNFNVIATNENNTESLSPATVSFIINPPYWKTWWFFTIITLLTSIILYFLYKRRVNEINKRNILENRLLKEVNKFRQKALSQQMNPHFIFNTLNSIQYYIYNNDVESSTHYLTKFSKLMRLILDNSQYETISIQKELEAMELYLQLESLRLDEKFSFEILVNEDVNTEYYKIYPLLIQPYVENSLWHGLVQEGEKMLKIEILPNKESILCIIEDNGIGREKALKKKKQQGKHKSHGTNITNKRIETINKLYNSTFKVEFIDLKDNFANSIGTRVLLQIPKITN